MPRLTTTPPTSEPVTLETAKAHCKVTQTDEDALIRSYIAAAREQAEHLTGRALAQATFELRLDAFTDCIELPRPPLISLAGIRYLDASSEEHDLAPEAFYLDDTGILPRILPVQPWPETSARPGCVRITYTAGYGAEALPLSLQQWMLLRIADMYEARETAFERALITAPRHFVDGLLDQWTILEAV